MERLKADTLNLQGWSIFSNIERPHAAIVMRDPLDAVIKGVRYQIIPIQENETAPVTAHKFLFETWCYQARGPIHHQTLMSFTLRNRVRYDTKVVKYIQDLRVLNKNLVQEERAIMAALKCAASVIDRINFNEHFDVFHVLERHGLVNRKDSQGYLSDCPCKSSNVSF